MRSYNNNNNNYNKNNNNNKQQQGSPFGDCLGSNLPMYDWAHLNLQPFTKVFYHAEQSTHTAAEAEKFRNLKEIFIKQSHVIAPHPFETWEEAFFPTYIMEEIQRAGFPYPTPIQSQSYPIVLSGHDLIGIAQTGSGKTLAYILPGIVHINAQATVKKGEGPIVLVLAPTRELAQQIQDESDKFGRSSKLKTACIYGGTDKYYQRLALQSGVDMIIATPGRLIDFLETDATNLRRVTYLVLDEADRMLDMGFEPQIRKILSQIRPDRQTLMFSATWPREVQQLACEFCHGSPIYIQIGNYENTINQNILQIIEVIGQKQKIQRLIRYLDSMTKGDKVIIFCQTKKGCEFLYRTLAHESFQVLPIHGDKDQQQRDLALENFKSGEISILVATDVASRGLDVRDITFVINYDFPKQIEDYIHRIGRTGRAGAMGTAISFLTYEEDRKISRSLIEVLEDGGQDVTDDLLALAGMRGQRNRNNTTQEAKQPVTNYADKNVFAAKQQQLYTPQTSTEAYQKYVYLDQQQLACTAGNSSALALNSTPIMQKTTTIYQQYIFEQKTPNLQQQQQQQHQQQQQLLLQQMPTQAMQGTNLQQQRQNGMIEKQQQMASTQQLCVRDATPTKRLPPPPPPSVQQQQQMAKQHQNMNNSFDQELNHLSTAKNSKEYANSGSGSHHRSPEGSAGQKTQQLDIQSLLSNDKNQNFSTKTPIKKVPAVFMQNMQLPTLEQVPTQSIYSIGSLIEQQSQHQQHNSNNNNSNAEIQAMINKYAGSIGVRDCQGPYQQQVQHQNVQEWSEYGTQNQRTRQGRNNVTSQQATRQASQQQQKQLQHQPLQQMATTPREKKRSIEKKTPTRSTTPVRYAMPKSPMLSGVQRYDFK